MFDLPSAILSDMTDNWLSYQTDSEVGHESLSSSLNLDDSLTSLQWLQEFSIINANVGKTHSSTVDPHGYRDLPSSAGPCSPPAADPACLGMAHNPGKRTSTSTSRAVHLGLQPMEEIDYKTNPHVKPPYSYATLICMAMQANKKTKTTLSGIYKWITDNFCYFRNEDPTWQNSIRHNLSVNKCFIKVPREKDEPGKGGFWKIDPQYADRLMNGALKKRRLPPDKIRPAFAGAQSLSTDNNMSSALPLTVNSESHQLLKEFKEATGEHVWILAENKGRKRKQPSPKKICKAPRLASYPLPSHEEQTGLRPPNGDFDWEVIFDTSISGNLFGFQDLEFTKPLSPGSHSLDLTDHGNNIDCRQQGSPMWHNQVTVEKSLDFDEACVTASFLQHAWDEDNDDYFSLLNSMT